MGKTRIEKFLESLVNGKTTNIKPRSRIEAYLKALIEKGIGGGSGGVSSWNDLTDKPFYTENGYTNTLSWNGDTTGKETCNDNLCNVGELKIESVEDLLGGSIAVTFDGETISGNFDSTTLISVTENITYIILYDQLLGVITLADNVELDGIILQSKGLWLLYLSDISLNYDIVFPSNVVYGEVVKKLDSKYIDAEWLAKKSIVSTTIVDNVTMSTSNGGNKVTAYTMPSGNFSTVTVIWDGVEYKCSLNTAMLSTSLGASLGWYFGSFKACGLIHELDTDEPFAFYTDSDATTLVVSCIDKDEHTFSLIADDCVVYNKLPKEYLPSTDDVSSYTVSTDLNTKLDSTEVANIVSLLKQNIPVYAKYNDVLGKILYINLYDPADDFYSILFTDCYNPSRLLMIHYPLGQKARVTGFYEDKIALHYHKYCDDGTVIDEVFEIAFDENGKLLEDLMPERSYFTMVSSSGKKYKVTIDDTGTFVPTELTE